MDYQQSKNQRKSYILMRSLKDITMAVMILMVGIVLLLGDKFGSQALKEFILEKDTLIRYLFGGLCLLYGGFRLFRGIKKDF
jgi:hypothetical protein